MFHKTLLSCALASTIAVFSGPLAAEDYVVDTQGAHASINFKIQHLGYSWLTGHFNDFSGTFSYDEKDPAASKVEVTIKTASIDSNHAERDKHLRGKGFLEVKDYPEAKFVSTAFTDKGDGKATLTGDFTFHGVTKPLTINVTHIGAGEDPWGGYRRGFSGTASFALKDFEIERDLGPASQEVELSLHVEGIRQD